MGSVEKSFSEWTERIPTDAEFELVKAVAMFYLGEENIRLRSNGGSHILIIEGSIMEIVKLARDNGYPDLPCLRGDNLSIPVKSGKKVKAVYINSLVKLINFKIQYDQYLKGLKGG